MKEMMKTISVMVNGINVLEFTLDGTGNYKLDKGNAYTANDVGSDILTLANMLEGPESPANSSSESDEDIFEDYEWANIINSMEK